MAGKLLLLAGMLGMSAGFSIIKHQPADTLYVTVGQSFSLMCKVDGYYEWCKYKKASVECDFEWKRSEWNITMQQCHSSFNGRLDFQGTYDKYECGIQINSAKLEDSGTWICDLEEYYSGGSRGSGTQVKQEFKVVVTEPTTPQPATDKVTSTTAESTAVETTSTTASTTTTESTTTESSGGDPIVFPTPDDETENDEDYNSESEASNDESASYDYDNSITIANGTATDELVQVEESDSGSNAGLPVGLAICIIVVFATLITLFGLHYKRRLHPCFYRMVNRPWKPVLHDEFPVTAEEEERNHPSIIKGGPSHHEISMNKLEEETMNIGADLTSVSWINEDNNKTEEVDTQPTSNPADPHKEIVEPVTAPTEDTPLQQDEENLNK